MHITVGSGTCIGFNPFLEHLFLVGSESGHVYMCSKAYTKHFLNITKVLSAVNVCSVLSSRKGSLSIIAFHENFKSHYRTSNK